MMIVRRRIVAFAVHLGPELGGDRARRRGDVGLQQPAAEDAQGAVRLRADARLDRAPAVVGRPVQQRRLGLVRLGRRTGDDQPPRRRRHAPEDQHDGEGLLQGRLPRQDARRGGQGPRPRAERPGGHRGRDRPGQRGGQAGHGRRGGRRSPGARRWRRSRRSRSTRPACGATSSRSTRGGSTTSTPTRSTPTSGWCSPPSSTSRSSAAIPTTSSIPRYDLDVCFFRAYEDDKPAQPEHYLKWSPAGTQGRRPRLRRRTPRAGPAG